MTAIAANPIYRDKKNRVWELDFLRGLAVIAMCFDHLMYDLAYFPYWFSNSKQVDAPVLEVIRQFALAYWNQSFPRDPGFRFWAHYIFVFLFLFLVGTSCAFSRSNALRGARLGIVAVAFTGVSFILKAMGIMDYGIVFGILHCIALSILVAETINIVTAFDETLNREMLLLCGFIILFAGIAANFWDMAMHYDKAFDWEHFIGYIMGTHAFGDDWFGLFPYVGMVLLGMYWGKTVYKERRSLFPALDGKWNKPFVFVGRHALIFYLAHQVVIAGIVILVCLCAGYRL